MLKRNESPKQCYLHECRSYCLISQRCHFREIHSEFSQTSKMGLPAKIVNSCKRLSKSCICWSWKLRLTYYQQIRARLVQNAWNHTLNDLIRSSHRMCSVRKDFLRNFTKFKGKDLCQNLFFNKVAGWGLQRYKERGSGTGVSL